MENFKKILNFIKLTNVFKQIERDIPLSQGLKLENDVEHSYQLAMVSWYIATIEDSNLNIEKILKYALIHDFPEIYAGDTPLYTANNVHLNSKIDRERESILRLKKEFSNFTDLYIWIKKYEEKVDDESKFVYAVDKLLPILSIYLDKGHAWKTHKINLDLIINKNKERISTSPIIKKYFDLILKIVKGKPELFDDGFVVFKEAINHNGERCDVHHVDIDHFDDLPDKLKLKAHAVCLHNGKMLLVNHPEWDIWSIPGGTRDFGESIEETLKREIVEETNCKVIDYRPIAYQKIVNFNGKVQHYRLQYLCNVVPLGDFKKDPAGNISKIAWIQPDNFEEYIEDKEFKRLVIRRALKLLKDYENKKN